MTPAAIRSGTTPTTPKTTRTNGVIRCARRLKQMVYANCGTVQGTVGNIPSHININIYMQLVFITLTLWSFVFGLSFERIVRLYLGLAPLRVALPQLWLIRSDKKIHKFQLNARYENVLLHLFHWHNLNDSAMNKVLLTGAKSSS